MSVEIFWEQKEFLRWNKSISIIFEGFSLTKTCLRPESAPLMLHSWQRGPNPSYFLNTPPILPTPFFQILYNPTLSCCLQPRPNCFFPTPTALLIPLGPVDWYTHINIYLHHLLCVHKSYLYYAEWTIHWYQKFTFHYAFSVQNLFASKSHICWLDAIILGSYCETNNTVRNSVNKTKQTYTYTKHSER